jgi:cytochrome c oxidase subunit 3
MWIFLVSDAFSFGGLLIAQGILQAGGGPWRQPGEPALAIVFTALLTFVLVSTSLTNVLAWAAAAGGRRREAALLLGLTALGGVAFLVGQYHEWFGIGVHGLLGEGLVFGASARASTFYVITGYHGLHVLVGVVYILAVLAGYLRGRVGVRQIELLGLYWCFVDFVWVFVFSFVYLLPSLSGA